MRSERLSRWFGLSYASWLTMPRVMMEAMPEEWQENPTWGPASGD